MAGGHDTRAVAWRSRAGAVAGRPCADGRRATIYAHGEVFDHSPKLVDCHQGYKDGEAVAGVAGREVVGPEPLVTGRRHAEGILVSSRTLEGIAPCTVYRMVGDAPTIRA